LLCASLALRHFTNQMTDAANAAAAAASRSAARVATSCSSVRSAGKSSGRDDQDDAELALVARHATTKLCARFLGRLLWLARLQRVPVWCEHATAAQRARTRRG
jgi:hypothetical protein